MINKDAKLYIGTLYCGENEFDDCTTKINNQKYKNFKHFVFKYLPNKEAHDTLFSDFLSKKEFNMLIKIDADAVLCEHDFFDRVIDLFEKKPDINLIEFVQYDFFEQVVNLGLNCYRQGFSIVDKGDLLVDRITDIPKEQRVISNYVSSVHCPNPSDFHAFHFGFHAQLKMRHKTLKNTLRAYLKTLNKKRALALCGAINVMKGTLDITNNYDFNDETIIKSTERYAEFSSVKLFFYIVSNYLFFKVREFFIRVKNYIFRHLRNDFEK